jgi:RNA polymerase sigma factor for flagellar operon FliA
VDYARVVVDNLPLVDSVVRFIARRHRLSADETDELGAQIRLKLVDNDYEVLRRFQERSSLRTYLTTVVHRHFLDARIAMWGKWRPSAQARRLGPVAILLDQYVNRDGLSFEEAVHAIQNKRGVDVTRAELEELLPQLPRRVQRRLADDEALADVAAPGGGEKAAVDALDRARDGERIEAALSAALGRLGFQDRLILKLRFCDDVTVARISLMMNLQQKPLYRRIEGVMRVLREELEARGVTQEMVSALIGESMMPLGKGVGDLLDGKPPQHPSLS